MLIVWDTLGRRPRSSRRPSRQGTAGWMAVAGGSATVVAAYVCGVVSISGRRLDAAWVRGAERIGTGVRPELHAIMEFGSIPAVLVGTGLIVLLCRRRGRGVDALQSILLVGGSELLTELTKAALPRAGGENTLPSGHITLIAALALAGVLVSPSNRRLVVAVAGSVVVVLAVLAVWVIGWHRPSDVVAAFGVVVACAGALTSARPALHDHESGPYRRSSRTGRPDHPVASEIP